MEHIFSIKHLKAGYLPNKPVIEIEHLNFNKGKVTFILGKSGIGKSTLLELLGLMNNTILSDSETSLQFAGNDTTYNYNEVWNLNDNKQSNFRNTNFSFIFQNENLMHNFTAGENMCFTQMLQGLSFNKAKATTLNLMQQLGINGNKFDAPVSEFSGGQRQRLSFIRAISTNYKVLFGDEPTGNLDFYNASKLMQLLKDDVNQKQASAIIVSHHIDLALQFADQIILITEKPVNQTGNERNITGEITESNVFNSKDWENNDEFKEQLEQSIR